MLFFRELATMVQSGLSIIDALADLAKNFPDASLRSAASYIMDDISSGLSLGDAFARFAHIFPEWQVGMIRYSEQSGRIAPTLTLIADQLEKDYASQLNLMTGLAYPLFILHVAIVLLPFTAFGSCGLARGLGLLVVLYLFAIIGFYILSRNNAAGTRQIMDSAVLSLPVVGNLVRQFCAARFCRALQSLSSAGVSIVTGWKLSADAAGNSVIKQSLLLALPVLESGRKISEALAVTRVFSDRAVQTISVGEKSGSIVQTLEAMAKHAERENEAATARLARVVPIVLYLAVALFIGIRVVSFYAGYYRSVFSY
jgi:type IV pilus assembly protein PilC